LKDIQPTFAFLILLLTSFIIISVVITQINAMIQLLQTIGEKASIESTYIQTILKIIGIAYVTELGANIVKDAGLASVASKLELAGKIFILPANSNLEATEAKPASFTIFAPNSELE